MRTFRLLGMALIAILVSVNFTACSSDDDEIIKDDDGVITNEKKLVEMQETYKEYTNIMTFSYDSKGKLISIVEKDYDSSKSDIINITWGENTVTESEDGESITYSLTDGLVRTGLETDGYKYSFAYNSSKQLTTYQYGDKHDSSTRTFAWENGRVTKIVYDGEISEITYDSKTCKGYFPLMVLMVEDDFKVMLAHPELIGMRITQLPSQSYSKDIQKGEYYDDYIKETNKYENIYESTTKFTYKLNSDGYVESVTMVETDVQTSKYSFQDKNGDGVISDDERNITNTHTDTGTRTYTFKWE
ncbi:hypothetical protein [Phocaeicola sp.]